MAANPNKPGPVHYALVVFVISTVVLGITTYMFHREYSDRAAKITELEGKAGTLNVSIKKLDDEIQALTDQTGNKFEMKLDPSNPKNATSVVGAAFADMERFGKDLSGTTYQQTLQKLREAVDAAVADVASKAAQVAILQKDINDQRDRLNKQVDTHRSAQEKSEADLRTTVASRDEKLNGKQVEIDRFKAENNQLVGELAQEKEGREKERKALQNLIGQLEIRIDFMRDKIDTLEGVSFEVADGLIRRVENAGNLAWIDLGEADGLKTRMTFSVYSKESQGVGRGAEDVKGKIEVTRLLGAHMAEARIVENDLYRPIVPNDLIYTPIWSPGLVEKISLAGMVDLDNDGKSDREQFKQLMAVSGAVLDNEITDEGERLPAGGKITVHTKFLVLGDVPDPTTLVSEKDKAINQKITDHLTELRKEARANGVRIIKINDFLAHIGFQSKRRLFRPGEQRPFNLKAGATSTQVNESLGDRSSSGTTSALFGKSKSAAQQTSSGTTSKVFGGGK